MLSVQLMACGPTVKKDQDTQGQITENVSAEEFHRLYTEKGGQMLDVRTAGELEAGYIPNAVNIDFYSNSFEDKLKDLDKTKPVFVYCAAGGRSGKAMQMMASMNFVEVYNLSGGFPTWEEAGFEVQK
jgi:rhodanese-related sulfurtransferase